MPKAKLESNYKPNKKAKKSIFTQNNARNSDSAVSEDENADALESPNVSENDKISDSDGYACEIGGQVSKMLEKFGNEINKTMQVKKKKMEQFTQEAMRMTVNKIFEVSKNQYIEREQVIEQFRKQYFSLIHEAEAEIAKSKEAEAKFQKLLTQNQKQHQQFRSSQILRLQALKNLSEEFTKGMTALEENHIESFSAIHNELRKDMAAMQKKMLLETQQQEMSNMRNQLKNML